jgi:hypothetical protein
MPQLFNYHSLTVKISGNDVMLHFDTASRKTSCFCVGRHKQALDETENIISVLYGVLFKQEYYVKKCKISNIFWTAKK